MNVNFKKSFYLHNFNNYLLFQNKHFIMNLLYGMVSPFTVLSIGIINIALVVTSLYFVFKSEKGFMAFLWTLFIIFVPFIGSLVLHL